jgi:hypothetical protein
LPRHHLFPRLTSNYTAIDSQAFTDVGVVAFCNKYPYFPSCAGFAGTSLELIAKADASSFGVASASASSGSGALAKSGAFVVTAGSTFSYVNGLLLAYVKAWLFSEAEAAALAFANSYTKVMSSSWAKSCVSSNMEYSVPTAAPDFAVPVQ